MITKRRSVAIVLGLIAGLLGIFYARYLHVNKTIDMSQFHGTLLSTPRPIHSFSLMGIDSKPFNNARLKGQWTLFFFGFTRCGSMCPTTMAQLSQTYRLLSDRNVKVLPQVVMISIDPARDSLDRLAHYVKAFNPHFYGARGNNEDIHQLTRELGVAYAKITNKNTENYDIEHTGTVMLINPQGQLAAFFTTPHQAKLIADDYMLLN